MRIMFSRVAFSPGPMIRFSEGYLLIGGNGRAQHVFSLSDFLFSIGIFFLVIFRIASSVGSMLILRTTSASGMELLVYL
jgi:hypothetical protein